MNDYELIKLGSLLHDIGKVVQRDIGKAEGSHSELGYKFLKALNEEIALFAKFHHIKEIDEQRGEFEESSITNLLWMVYEADNLSSAERGKMVGEFNPKHPLISVFSKVRLDKEVKKEMVYPLTKLNFNEFVFPGFEKGRAESKIEHRSYKEIYDDFKDKFPYFYSDLILAFLEEEATFIPARTGEDEDISLFDHLKTTCAIASCMYLYHKGALDKDIKDRILDRGEEKYLLISGDISGIQRFIYNITSKGALKLLRARSFYLEMISEDFVQELLNELDLSRANLLYCAGGHFYILAPNTEECKKRVDELKEKLNEWLLNEFEGNLYYAIGYIPFCGNQFEVKKEKDRSIKEDFSDLWGKIGERVAEQKSKKFSEFLINEPDRFLREDCRDKDYLRKKEQCDACKMFVSKSKLLEFNVDDKKYKYCEMCHKLLKVGKKLAEPENKFILRFNKKANNMDLELPFSKIRIVKEIEGDNFNTIFQINSFDIPLEIIKLKDEYKFNFVPLLIGDYSSGNDLDTSAKGSMGIDKIGILRMDVDNLGKIFRGGLPEELRTISRITNLSRFLNYFFKGYLNLIGEFEDKNINGICNSVWNGGRLKQRKNRDFTIVYAGGDDLLIVGSWDDVFELAFDINATFRRYVGENQNITISAGFCIFDPKFPFYKMAEISGEKEEKAKEEGRNRIWLFERGMKEGSEEKFKESIEWDKSLDTWHDFRQLLNGGKLRVSKGTITKLLTINNAYKENPDKVSWAIDLAYWYGRLQDGEKRYFEKIIGKYSTIQVIQVKQPSEIYYIDIPLRILDFATRGGE